MGCGSFGSDKILVGLHLVGVTGMRSALRTAEKSGLSEQKELLDLIVMTVASDNYLPPGSQEIYRRSLWREWLRYKGEDFSDFFSEIEVAIPGDPGPERYAFLEMMHSVFRELELSALVEYKPPVPNELNPQLWIAGEPIVRGNQSREKFKAAVHRSISEW